MLRIDRSRYSRNASHSVAAAAALSDKELCQTNVAVVPGCSRLLAPLLQLEFEDVERRPEDVCPVSLLEGLRPNARFRISLGPELDAEPQPLPFLLVDPTVGPPM